MTSKTPLGIILDAMRAHSKAGNTDEAVKLARFAAPYKHPRAGIDHTIRGRRSPSNDVRTLSDAELVAAIERLEARSAGADELTVQPD